MLTSSRAGVGAVVADSVAEIIAISAIDPHAIINISGVGRLRIVLLRTTPVLRLTWVAELRISAVFEQNFGSGLVVQNAAKTVTKA